MSFKIVLLVFQSWKILHIFITVTKQTYVINYQRTFVKSKRSYWHLINRNEFRKKTLMIFVLPYFRRIKTWPYDRCSKLALIRLQ